MLTLLKKACVYSPENLGVQDILLGGDKILKIAPDLTINGIDAEEIDCSGLIAVPGFVDQHVHLIGGGGEGGFATRTPEVMLSKVIEGGITTMVGCLGTDGVSRSLEALLSKAKGLEEEGISTYVYSGSYELPLQTLTGSLRKDLLYIDKVVGAGEIALSDHRSSAPTLTQIKQLAAEARVGGMLSGKAGVVHLHLGDGEEGLSMINEILENSDIPIYHFRPTHVNRSRELFLESVAFAKKGGMVDLTAGITPAKDMPETRASLAVRYLLEQGVPMSKITISSDGNGSMPVFDENGVMLGITVAPLSDLHRVFCEMVKEAGLSVTEALMPITANPADGLKLAGKGRLAEQFDGDLNLLDENLNLVHVFAKGRPMMKNGQIVVKGTYE